MKVGDVILSNTGKTGVITKLVEHKHRKEEQNTFEVFWNNTDMPTCELTENNIQFLISVGKWKIESV
jgi:hypothetical protein